MVGLGSWDGGAILHLPSPRVGAGIDALIFWSDVGHSFNERFDQHGAWRRAFAHRLGRLGQWMSAHELMDVHDTGISLERFERIVGKTDYKISNKLLYLINPIYKYKFKLKPRKQFGLIAAIPWVRNFWTTCGYYLITPTKSKD